MSYKHLKDGSYYSELFGRSFTLGIIASALLFFLFISLAYSVIEKDLIVEVDRQVMNFVALHRTPETAPLFLFLTHLGSGAVITGLGLALTMLFSLFDKRRQAYFLITSVIVGQLFYWFFKMLIQRARPDEIYAWVESGGYSFPSGHTTSSTLFYGLIGFFVWHLVKKKWMKALVIGVFGSVVFLIGLSRLYLGVHWPSDILAGWILGSSLLVAFAGTFMKEKNLS